MCSCAKFNKSNTHKNTHRFNTRTIWQIRYEDIFDNFVWNVHVYNVFRYIWLFSYYGLHSYTRTIRQLGYNRTNVSTTLSRSRFFALRGCIEIIARLDRRLLNIVVCRLVFSERTTLRSLYAIGRPSVVCLSVCLLSVCYVDAPYSGG